MEKSVMSILDFLALLFCLAVFYGSWRLLGRSQKNCNSYFNVAEYNMYEIDERTIKLDKLFNVQIGGLKIEHVKTTGFDFDGKEIRIEGLVARNAGKIKVRS